jgi:hypothetical protein
MAKRMVAVCFSPVHFPTEKRKEKGWREVGGGGDDGRGLGFADVLGWRLKGRKEWLEEDGVVVTEVEHASCVLPFGEDDNEPLHRVRRGTAKVGWAERRE